MDADGDKDVDADGLREADGLSDVDPDGEIDAEGDRDNDTEAEADTEGETDAVALTLALTFPNPNALKQRYRFTEPETVTRWAVCAPVTVANVNRSENVPRLPL